MDSRDTDQDFVVEIDNDRRTTIRFGNDDQGTRPAPETQFWASYRVGNGPVGNIGQNKLFHIVYRDTPVTAIEGVSNPLPATGGTDAESNQHAKMLAPQAFRTLQRAILQDDYRELVMRDFPLQVQQARATLQQVGTRNVVTVVFDPASAVRDVEKLKKAIQARLNRYKRMGHEVDVRQAQYVGLDIQLKVTASSGYLRGQIHRELMVLFGAGELIDGRKAFFHPDNLTFGDSIYLSRIVAEAKKINGLANIIVTRLARHNDDAAAAQQHLDDGVLTLGAFEIPSVSNNAAAQNRGKILITMEGGK
jgi:predicted phage baseplate assembly protein